MALQHFYSLYTKRSVKICNLKDSNKFIVSEIFKSWFIVVIISKSIFNFSSRTNIIRVKLLNDGGC